MCHIFEDFTKQTQSFINEADTFVFNNVLYYHKVREGFARIAADTELEMQAFGLQLAQTLGA